MTGQPAPPLVGRLLFELPTYPFAVGCITVLPLVCRREAGVCTVVSHLPIVVLSMFLNFALGVRAQI